MKATLTDTIFADIPLAIGLQQGYYSTEEGDGFVQVCVEVESGDISGRSISIDYTTADGSAQGIHHSCCVLQVCNRFL